MLCIRRHIVLSKSFMLLSICLCKMCIVVFFFSSRRRHTRFDCDWSSDVCSSDLLALGGWTADADVLVEPFRRVPVMKSLLLGFSPYGFFGVGGYGVRPYAAADTSVATLNYGLGAHHDLLGWLGVGVEARYRRPLHSDSALTFCAPRTWQHRLGLTASFGGGRPWRRSTIRQDPPPRSTIVEHRVYVSPAPPPPPPPRYIIEPSGNTSRLASRVLATAGEYVGA